MAEATLAIRDHEELQLFDLEAPPEWRVGERVYAVALVTTPPMPPPGNRHPISTQFAVVCAGYYTTPTQHEMAWGWINLTPETKQEIGAYLEDIRAEADKFYWLVVRPPTVKLSIPVIQEKLNE